MTTEVVRVDGGLIEGLQQPHGMRAWLGVPFAAPPVGPLRWRPPQPVPPWAGVRPAQRFAPQCVQPGRKADSVYFEYAGVQPMDEDCLYLNVWSAAPDAKLPVMVWFHGGGWQQGAGSNPVFTQGDLARRGVVLVTFNYRLGPFGFLAHPALTAESPDRASGHYGLLDMEAALRWVQRNIAAFGGDPANVTIFGQSAGAAGVIDMMAAPRTRGLFRQAVAQSFGIARMGGLDEAERFGSGFARRIGADGADALRTLPAQTLLQRYLEQPHRCMPFADGAFLARPVQQVFAAGEQQALPLLTGWNRDEGTTFPPAKSASAFRDQLAERFGARAAEALRLYPADDEAQARASSLDFIGDDLFAWGVRTAAKAHARVAPTWVYHFDHAQPFKPGQRWAEAGDARALGVFHSSEYPYLFGSTGVLTRDWGDADRRVTRLMQDLWLNFARGGDPNGAGLAHWPRYDDDGPSLLRIAEAPSCITVPRRAHLDFIGS